MISVLGGETFHPEKYGDGIDIDRYQKTDIQYSNEHDVTLSIWKTNIYLYKFSKFFKFLYNVQI